MRMVIPICNAGSQQEESFSGQAANNLLERNFLPNTMGSQGHRNAHD
jgi:hypothetical protein